MQIKKETTKDKNVLKDINYKLKANTGFTRSVENGLVQSQVRQRRARQLDAPNNSLHYSAGFTFIELLVSIAVIAVIVVLSISAFSRFNKRQELNTAVNEIQSVLEEARSLTLASKGNSIYGVHFDSDQVTRFSGNSYSAVDPDNVVTKLSSRITITTTSFAGGGSDVLFERLTGSTNNSGTIIVSFKSDTSASTTITLHATGVVE